MKLLPPKPEEEIKRLKEKNANLMKELKSKIKLIRQKNQTFEQITMEKND